MTPEELSDIRSIEQVYVRYCEIVDAKDFDRMDEVFTAETYGDYSHSLGPGVVTRSRDELVGSMHRNLGPASKCGPTHHNVGNFRVRLAGDEATAKVNYFAVHRGKDRAAGDLYSMWGEYDDRLVRTGAGWRVAHRVYRCFVTDGPDSVLGAVGD